MPRYFFHIQDGESRIEDPEGSEAGNEQVALHEAEAAVREMLANAVRTGRGPVEAVLIVADEQGHQVGSFRFADVLPENLKQ